jgi:hypothetical protein
LCEVPGWGSQLDARRALGPPGFLAIVLHQPEASAASMAAITRSADLIAAAGGEILVLAAATDHSGYDRQVRLSAIESTTLGQMLAQAEPGLQRGADASRTKRRRRSEMTDRGDGNPTTLNMGGTQ